MACFPPEWIFQTLGIFPLRRAHVLAFKMENKSATVVFHISKTNSILKYARNPPELVDLEEKQLKNKWPIGNICIMREKRLVNDCQRVKQVRLTGTQGAHRREKRSVGCCWVLIPTQAACTCCKIRPDVRQQLHHAALTVDSFQFRLDPPHVRFTGRGQVSIITSAGSFCCGKTSLLGESLKRRDNILRSTTQGNVQPGQSGAGAGWRITVVLFSHPAISFFRPGLQTSLAHFSRDSAGLISYKLSHTADGGPASCRSRQQAGDHHRCCLLFVPRQHNVAVTL